MTKQCQKCNVAFNVTDDDLAFLNKVSPILNGIKYLLNPPTLCPNCRQIRRQSHINEINLYRRKDDLTGKDILSNYHPSSPFKVYNQEYWWGDQWDAREYGQEYDLSKTFFEQFKELMLKVPRPNLFTGIHYDENCDYTNYAGKNKNCYLMFDADYCRDTYYSYSTNHAINCVDNYRTRACELCYEAVDCKGCYNCKYISNSSQCTDSAFLDNCESCKNCFMCTNQQRKEYFIFNRQGTKEEYEKLTAELESHDKAEQYKRAFEEIKQGSAKKYMHGFQNENASGDYIYNCKNTLESFDCNEVYDGKYLYQTFGSQIKDCQDCDEIGDGAELCYESSNSGYNVNHIICGINVLDQNSDIYYSNQCHYSNNLFGCIGMRRNQYCILNKQYTKEEYETLVPRIIEKMKQDGEWGEHFPESLSPFAYNESMAMDYAPLTQNEALARGLKWRDDDKKKVAQTVTIADSISQIPNSITQEILACEACMSNFKIIPQELEFYRTQKLPIPTQCFKCRHYARMRSRNPRTLYDRTCFKCATSIKTTYSPNRPEQVYCEKCYLEAVH